MNRSRMLQRVIPNQFPYPTNGVVSYWKLNEDPAIHNTVIADSFGSNNGTLITNDGSTNKSIGGKINSALNFDGSDDYIDISSFDPSGYTEFTISVWINPAVATGQSVGIIHGWNNDSSRQILIRGNSGDIQFFTYTTGQVGGAISTFTANEWQHFSFVYDGETMNCYKNAVVSGTSYSQTGSIKTSNNVIFDIGGRDPSSSNISGYYHNGLIDDVLIYNRSLSASEIQQIYNYGA